MATNVIVITLPDGSKQTIPLNNGCVDPNTLLLQNISDKQDKIITLLGDLVQALAPLQLQKGIDK